MAITEIFHDAATIAARTQAGDWPGKTLGDYLREHARDRPDKVAIVDRAHRVTFRELERRALRVACGFHELGVRSGDVVSVQLPNWSEWLVVHCGLSLLGAVTNSIGAMYRRKEVEYILNYAESRMLVIPDVYRGFSHVEMIAEIWPTLPSLKDVLVVGDTTPTPMHSFAEFEATPWETGSEAVVNAIDVDPNSIATLMFTSGTTANPKGVMHTHNTIGAGSEQAEGAYGLTSEDVVFMASPIGHTTALLVGARIPVMYGMTTVWQEHWNPEEAIDLIAAEGCTFTLSATPFLYGLVHSANATRERLKTLKTFACGGAPIPRDLIRQAESEYGFLVSAVYGSSEALLNSLITADDPSESRYATDGKLIHGVGARLVDVDESGEGELQIQTPALYAGYYKDAEHTAEVVDRDNWYSTGDLCTLVDDYVSVVGRKKDMIIRGGANISAREIEELLFTHPKIATVACVAMPDPVLAERVCAYVVCESGVSLEFGEMIDYLRDKQVSAWKLPERLEIREAFPMTPSGKIQKFLLRDEIAEMLERESG